jgi:putative SOS response-associated peptidase YedK
MYTWEELIRLYRLTVPNIPSNLQPRYNICLTTTIDAVVEKEGKRALEPMRCGLVPAWWNTDHHADWRGEQTDNFSR